MLIYGDQKKVVECDLLEEREFLVKLAIHYLEQVRVCTIHRYFVKKIAQAPANGRIWVEIPEWLLIKVGFKC